MARTKQPLRSERSKSKGKHSSDQLEDPPNETAPDDVVPSSDNSIMINVDDSDESFHTPDNFKDDDEEEGIEIGSIASTASGHASYLTSNEKTKESKASSSKVKPLNDTSPFCIEIGSIASSAPIHASKSIPKEKTKENQVSPPKVKPVKDTSSSRIEVGSISSSKAVHASKSTKKEKKKLSKLSSSKVKPSHNVSSSSMEFCFSAGSPLVHASKFAPKEKEKNAKCPHQRLNLLLIRVHPLLKLNLSQAKCPHLRLNLLTIRVHPVLKLNLLQENCPHQRLNLQMKPTIHFHPTPILITIGCLILLIIRIIIAILIPTKNHGT